MLQLRYYWPIEIMNYESPPRMIVSKKSGLIGGNLKERGRLCDLPMRRYLLRKETVNHVRSRGVQFATISCRSISSLITHARA